MSIPRKRPTVYDLRALKGKRQLTMLRVTTLDEAEAAEQAGIDIVSMKLTGEIKELTDGSGNTVKAKSVILAMGSAYKEIGLPNEKRLSGRGVSWCATCDGFFVEIR